MDILLNNELLVMKFCTDVKNIHMEGTVSQIVYIGLSLILFEKTGNFLWFFE